MMAIIYIIIAWGIALLAIMEYNNYLKSKKFKKIEKIYGNSSIMARKS